MTESSRGPRVLAHSTRSAYPALPAFKPHSLTHCTPPPIHSSATEKDLSWASTGSHTGWKGKPRAGVLHLPQKESRHSPAPPPSRVFDQFQPNLPSECSAHQCSPAPFTLVCLCLDGSPAWSVLTWAWQKSHSHFKGHLLGEAFPDTSPEHGCPWPRRSSYLWVVSANTGHTVGI